MVRSNPKLASIEGLSALRRTAAIVISDDPAIDSLRGLRGLEHTEALEVRDALLENRFTRITGNDDAADCPVIPR